MKCKKCGATYEIESQDYPMRDKDSILCQYCGSILIEWNAGVIYSAKNISGPTKKNYLKNNTKRKII
jgi:NAD-dependent SIR2 family protein deacetylase